MRSASWPCVIHQVLGALLVCSAQACSDDDEPASEHTLDAASQASADTAEPKLEPFSFFVTSYAALTELSGSADGFGGDLRYGEADGLAGADKICTEIAEKSMAGAKRKRWRAFLSVTAGPDGSPVHAIDRVGEGPWYDRLGRLVAMTRTDLLAPRPKGDPVISDNLPNEHGVPNHDPDGTGEVDNHDILTGTNKDGQLYSPDWANTCHDWTSSVGSDGRPRVGHSWPRDFKNFDPTKAGFMPPPGGFPKGGFMIPADVDGVNWMSSLNEAGCAAGVNLIERGPPDPNDPSVGSGGGYGGIYCFALTP